MLGESIFSHQDDDNDLLVVNRLVRNPEIDDLSNPDNLLFSTSSRSSAVELSPAAVDQLIAVLTAWRNE